MIETNVSAASDSAHSGLCAKLDEHAIVVVRAQLGDRAGPTEHTQANHTFVISDRTIEVGDLKTNATDVRGIGEAESRRTNAVACE